MTKSLTPPQVANRQHVLSHMATAKATVGTWTYSQNGGAYFNSYVSNSSSAANGDAITFYEVYLDAGTWQLDLLGFASADGAQVAASLLGTAVTIAYSGTQEQYAASSAPVRTALAGVTITSPGLYALKLTITGKNATSTGFKARCSGAILTRTA